MSMIKVSQNCGTYQDKPHNLEVFMTKKKFIQKEKNSNSHLSIFVHSL